MDTIAKTKHNDQTFIGFLNDLTLGGLRSILAHCEKLRQMTTKPCYLWHQCVVCSLITFCYTFFYPLEFGYQTYGQNNSKNSNHLWHNMHQNVHIHMHTHKNTHKNPLHTLCTPSTKQQQHLSNKMNTVHISTLYILY